MKAIAVILFTVLLAACQQTPKGLRKIRIRDYVFDFPADFKFSENTDLKSYSGKISNGTITFVFNYGLYSSPLAPSLMEHAASNDRKLDAIYRHRLHHKKADWKELLRALRPISIARTDSLHFQCTYLLDEDTIYYESYIPNETLESQIKEDTLGNVRYKLVTRERGKKGIAGLHVKDLTCQASDSKCEALSLIASSLDAESVRLATQILKSCRRE